MPEPQTLMTGLALGESPRWHEDRLWFSDWGAQEVIAVDVEGNSEVILRVQSPPFCIDFLPDGRLLIVSGREGRLLRRESDGSMVPHADLTGLSERPWNDIVVDGRGNVYVNNIGFDFPAGEFAPGIIAVVTRDGSATQVADGIAFPNGMVVTPDNSTLIVAESYGDKLTAFDIATDGTLSNRRIWAPLGGGHPDGICLDAENAAWYGDVPARRCVRVREGGEVLQAIDLDRGCFACMLGGHDRTTLFAATANPEAPNEVEVSQPSDALVARAKAKSALNSLFLGLGIVSLLVGAIGVANIMLISVLERRSEIGLRRALGATKGHIRIQFLAEAILLALLGGAIGVGAGAASTAIYAAAKGWAVVVPALASGGGFGAALLIGAVTGLLPALRAARMSPTEALWTV